jgi:hypothetical protein
MKRGQYKTRVREKKITKFVTMCVYFKFKFLIGIKHRIELFTPWSPSMMFDNLSARKRFVPAKEEVTTVLENRIK